MKFNTKWITAIVLATCFASTNVTAGQDTGSPSPPGHPAAQTVKMTDADAQNVVRPDNIARARILGVETAARADLLQHLRVRGSLTWLDSEDRSEIAARRGESC